MSRGLISRPHSAMSIALMVAIKNGGDFWGPKAVNFGISYWSLSIGLNILLTILIGGKLWSMRSKVHSAMGKQHAGPYTSLLSMLIESAALYSIWGMVFIIMYGRNSPAQNLFLPPLGQVQVRHSLFDARACTDNDLKGHRASADYFPPRAGQRLESCGPRCDTSRREHYICDRSTNHSHRG